jgi:hypothetical protein
MFVDVTCLDRADQFVDQRRIFCELQLFGGTIEVGHDDNNHNEVDRMRADLSRKMPKLVPSF